MLIVDLNGTWQIESLDGQFALAGTVPGSFFYDLEKSGYWGEHDVFYRENNRQCVDIADRDFRYHRSFHVPPEFFDSGNRLYLEADGLDTLAEIRINGRAVAHTDNMFRRFRFEVRDYLRAGENDIEIIFRNSLAEIARQHQRRPLWNPAQALDGAVHLRKSHCSFGWDWGPVIPDLGIWQPIRLVAYRGAHLTDFRSTQQHDNGSVTLAVTAQLERWQDVGQVLELTTTAPDGEKSEQYLHVDQATSVTIANPQLWWPNGYGEQPLYELECRLLADGEVIDQRIQKIGLRQMRLERLPDQFGESFQFNINGIAIFARGANYIPEDVYLTRTTRESTERLLRDAVAANFNCLRVWGGGVYPNDDFFDLCDQHGLIVWQDLMFACGVYDIRNPKFVVNIKEEVRDVLRRIRHHACLGLLCGNNEMEWGFEVWDFPRTKEMRAEYLKQYEILFPEIVAEICPEIDYWPASPSSGGYFDEPNAEHRGDVHYWEVWHGSKPFTEFRQHHFRFLSEFGFESFPALKTIESFTTPGDRNIFSPVMEDHQRCEGGNGRILSYLSQYFRYPKDLRSLVYVSQLSQAEAIRCAVEHLRRHRGRCMGATYWQLNDNWPVASWSSIDYYGRWKALHYFAKRMYHPLLLSCADDGGRAAIHLSNEHNRRAGGRLEWRLLSLDGEVIESGHKMAILEPLSSRPLAQHDFCARLRGNRNREFYLAYSFEDKASGERFRGTCCFARYKQLDLRDPQLHVKVEEHGEAHDIAVTATSFAKFVELDLREGDLVFSDNYFDLNAGETHLVTVHHSAITVAALQQQLTVRSLCDSY